MLKSEKDTESSFFSSSRKSLSVIVFGCRQNVIASNGRLRILPLCCGTKVKYPSLYFEKAIVSDMTRIVDSVFKASNVFKSKVWEGAKKTFGSIP